MTKNSSDACWSSDDSSFGWVDMEDREPAAATKSSTIERTTSDSEDGSSDDSYDTQFDPKCENRPVLNAERDHKQTLKRNDPVSIKTSRGQVKIYDTEDSDSTQFDAESDNRPVVENRPTTSKGKNEITVKRDQLKSPGTINSSNHRTSINTTSGESGSESSDGSDKKDLKPFTKRLLVKKERSSHALSDDSDVESPSLQTRLRVKSESGKPPQKTREDIRATLIEGVLVDTAQPLPFDIGGNEDVWIVQCPNEVSETTLKGKTLNFNGISCAEQFEGSVLFSSNPKPVNLLLPKSPLKLSSITPRGHIIFKEKEMAPNILHPVCNEDNITSLPAGLKERHPLFGADLSLVQRLSPQLLKRKKKKKKSKQDVSDLGPTFCKGENGVTEAENGANFSNDLDASSIHNKKKKKKIKHLVEQTVAFSQESGIKNHDFQLSPFHSGSSPKITSEKNRNEFDVSNCFESEVKQKKHRKVKHEPGEAISPEITNFHPELAFVTPSKKRKHKHLEHSFESDRPMAEGTSDEAENTLSQKRKKRKYDIESSTSYSVCSTSERTSEPSESFTEISDHISSKKKKHHKYERDLQSKNIETVNNKSEELAFLSQDMKLGPVTDELLHTLKKKKKKKIKENDTEFLLTSDVKTNSDINCISTKKKKKVKMENNDKHLGQLSFDASDTKNDVCDVTGADLDYFNVSRKKLHKEKRRKLETGDPVEFSEENSAHSKLLKHTFNNSLSKLESSYVDHLSITDVHHKKKKKRKSE